MGRNDSEELEMNVISKECLKSSDCEMRLCADGGTRNTEAQNTKEWWGTGDGSKLTRYSCPFYVFAMSAEYFR